MATQDTGMKLVTGKVVVPERVAVLVDPEPEPEKVELVEQAKVALVTVLVGLALVVLAMAAAMAMVVQAVVKVANSPLRLWRAFRTIGGPR